MTDYIKNLTPEQEALIPEYVEKYKKIACSTEPVDQEEVVTLINKLYECHGYEPPKEIKFLPSPRAVVDESGADPYDLIFGNDGAFWFAFYDFFDDNFEQIKYDPEYYALRDVCLNGGTFVCSEDTVYMSERPVFVNELDENHQLHAEDGPAIRFADGWAIYSWHGVQVPGKFFDKEWLTAERALTWENLEERRVACELVGWYEILQQLKATTVDKDGDPSIGELVECMLPDDDEPQKFLIVRCATERTFALEVPRDMKTALEANSWTWGLDEKQYIPQVQS